jgi:hypothetical protein
MTKSKKIAFKPFLGGFVLETLTVGMYGESRNAIREYIQNGFDSIERAIKDLKILSPGKGLIQIIMADDKDSLVIKDNGIGLTAHTAVNTLTSVGASTKDHTSDAGFRGIGRLAGIVFSNRVTFTTKAPGETEQTTVVFNGERMREAMTPAKGSTMSAEDLIRDCVEASVATVRHAEEHFFEVKLEGFVDAPAECTSFNFMEKFVSQVAPVPYSKRFPYRDKLLAAAAECDLPIEEVNIKVKDGQNKPVEITKVYQDKYKIETAEIKLADCMTRVSDDKNWWAWIGKKHESGAYKDPLVSGLRIRMKNIQIDGTEVVRDIFRRQGASYIRFQDWFVGEIFVRPSFLVPNARRDGFEETKHWKAMRAELGRLAKELRQESYDVSNKGQLTIAALEAKVVEKRDEIQSLRRSEFRNVDRTIALSAEITELQKKIDKALKGADLEVAATLQALGSELTDFKMEALSKIGTTAAPPDTERVQHQAREELLNELITVFESELPAACAVAVRNLLRKQYQFIDPP